MIGTALALVLGELAKAGGEVAGSAISSHGANAAAKTQADAVTAGQKAQTDAANKAAAAAAEQENYNRYQTWAQQQARAPYVNAGNQSLSALAGALQLPTPNLPTAPTNVAPPGPLQMPGQRQPEPYAPGSATLAAYMQNGGAQSQQREPTVMLEAPNGERRAVPQSQEAMYIAKGAKQVQS